MAVPVHTPNHIHFVDVGAGAERGRAYEIALRRHKAGRPGRIVAVDLEAPKYTHNLPNLEHVKGDATKYFRGLDPGIVDIINFDLSLADPAGEKRLLSMYPDAPQSERHVVLTQELSDAMKHAMHDRSRIVVNTSRTVVDPLDRTLKNQGFATEVTPLRKVWGKTQSRAWSTGQIMGFAGRDGFIDHSMQIVARKPKEK